MVTREEILALVPHQGDMCLLDEVLSWDAVRIACRTTSHRRAPHPLGDGRGLRGLHLCEYGAQAMAVHGGLLARESGGRAPPGLLVALRDVRIARARVDDLPGPLDVHAEALLRSGTSWQYAFGVHHAGDTLAEGRAAVVLAPCAAETGAER